MKIIAESLVEMKEQSRIRGHIAAADDADFVLDLLEDIRDAMIDYQVSYSTFSSPLRIILSIK